MGHIQNSWEKKLKMFDNVQKYVLKCLETKIENVQKYRKQNVKNISNIFKYVQWFAPILFFY